MNRPAAIQTAIDTATTPTQDVNFHSNVYNRTGIDAAAAAERTLQMAEALYPVILDTYGPAHPITQDALIAIDRAANALMDSIFPVAA